MVRTCPWYCVFLAAVDHSDCVCFNPITHHFLASCSGLPSVSLYFPSLLKRYSHSLNAIASCCSISIEAIRELADLRKTVCTEIVLEVQLVLLTFLCLETITFTRGQPRELFMTPLLLLILKVRVSFTPSISAPTLTCLKMTKKVCFWTCFLFSSFIFFQFSGALGGLTCVLCAYLGAEAAKVLLVFPANKQRIVRWMLWALVTVSSKIEY